MINEEVSYLLGVYFGDGHVAYVKTPKYSYQLSIVSEDEDLCLICKNIIYEEFDKVGATKNVNNSYYKLIVCSKEVCEFVLDLMCSNKNYYEATRYEKKAIIPDVCLKEFIKGAMDSDGWISKRKNGKYTKYEIGFKNTSILSQDLRIMMTKCGIQCNKLTQKKKSYKCRDCKPFWSWTINTKNYIEKIGFRINRKQKLCSEYMEYINDKKNI